MWMPRFSSTGTSGACGGARTNRSGTPLHTVAPWVAASSLPRSAYPGGRISPAHP